jgi:hypothetical protein
VAGLDPSPAIALSRRAEKRNVQRLNQDTREMRTANTVLELTVCDLHF